MIFVDRDVEPNTLFCSFVRLGIRARCHCLRTPTNRKRQSVKVFVGRLVMFSPVEESRIRKCRRDKTPRYVLYHMGFHFLTYKKREKVLSFILLRTVTVNVRSTSHTVGPTFVRVWKCSTKRFVLTKGMTYDLFDADG